MKILAFSDWRVQSSDYIKKIIKETAPEIVMYAGDDLQRVIPTSKDIFLKTNNHFIKLNKDSINDKKIFVVNKKNKLLFQKFINQKLENYHPPENYFDDVPFYYVNGNDDDFDDISLENNGELYIRISSSFIAIGEDFFSVCETPKKKITFRKKIDNDGQFNGIYVRIKIKPSFGFNKISPGLSMFGSSCTFGIETKIIRPPNKFANIYLSHIPPKGILDLSVRFGINHIGSDLLRKAVLKYKPDFVLCGHSHFWGGKAVNVNGSIVINISSHDNPGSNGNYCIIDTENKSYEFKQVDFKSVSQIRGGYCNQDKRIEIYGDTSSIFSVNLLEEKEMIIDKLENANKKRLSERIKSLDWKKPKIIKNISFDPSDKAYVDVETGLANGINPGKLWLIGILYKGEVTQYEYPKQKKEFLNFIKKNDIKEFVSWTRYDKNALSSLINIRFIDACQRSANCIVWHSYKLHELYDAIFSKKDIDMIDGAVAGLYADHILFNKRKCEYCPSKKEVVSKIKSRNKKDLLQMYELCKFLWEYKLD